jgi:hypothetical protein
LRQNRCKHQRLRRAKRELHRMKPESFPLKNPLISNKEEREYNDKKLKTKRMQRLGDAAFNSVAGTRGTASMTSFAWSSAAKWPLRTIRMRQARVMYRYVSKGRCVVSQVYAYCSVASIHLDVGDWSRIKQNQVILVNWPLCLPAWLPASLLATIAIIATCWLPVASTLEAKYWA